VRDTSANGGATGMSTAKTNDLKPMWGEVFADSLLRGYEWWGYLQEDVLLGDVTVCIPPWLLSQADVISPYVFPMNTSGVFMLLRNREAVNLAWRQSADAAHVLSSPRYLVFDEWRGEARDSFAATLGREHEAGRLRVHTADSKKWWSHDLRERRPMAVCWRRIRNGRSALFVSAGNELPSLPCLGASGAAAREALLAGGERCFFHLVEYKREPAVKAVDVGWGAPAAQWLHAADEFTLTRDGWWLPVPALVPMPPRGSSRPAMRPALEDARSGGPSTTRKRNERSGFALLQPLRDSPAYFGAAALHIYFARLALCADLDDTAASRRVHFLERGWCWKQKEAGLCSLDARVRLLCPRSCNPDCVRILPTSAEAQSTGEASGMRRRPLQAWRRFRGWR